MATVTVRFDEFGWDALTTAAERLGVSNAELVAASCRRFPPQAAERPPRFAQTGSATMREVTIDLDRDRLAALDHQATALGVEVDAIIRHNVFRLLAEVGAGEAVPGLTGENGDVV